VNSGASSAYYIRLLREAARAPGEGQAADLPTDITGPLVASGLATIALGIAAPLLLLLF
jgi:NADH:ubiquinone oxidoreductase subunit 2 (subunit N)